MRCTLLLFGVLSLSLAQAYMFVPRHGIREADPPNARARTPQWGVIKQKLDNFDPANTQYWNMRVIGNNQFCTPDGPTFIMLGAEWTISEDWLQGGQMFDMARQHGACMYYTEHRYYGRSFPTSDLSPQNLKYLTTEQALADVAKFITDIKAASPNTKVVVFGGSYGGNMAIWMREKYPNLVHAALSSSAPVLAEVDFYQYYEVVNDALGPSCASIITAGVDKTLQLLKSAAGVQQMQRDYNLCQPLDVNDDDDVEYFFLSVMSTFGGKIQYANQNTVSQICNALSNPPSSDDYTRFTAYIRQQHQTCSTNYAVLVQYLSSWDLNRGDTRSWIYQTCTEYGFFQTTTSNNQPFRHTCPVDMFYSWCRDIFGPQFTAAVVHNGVVRKNSIYGGLHPNVSRVVSVHGTLDPWHALGLSTPPGPKDPVMTVKGTSHTADLNSISPYDPPAMQAAKRAEQTYISQWLAEP